MANYGSSKDLLYFSHSLPLGAQKSNVSLNARTSPILGTQIFKSMTYLFLLVNVDIILWDRGSTIAHANQIPALIFFVIIEVSIQISIFLWLRFWSCPRRQLSVFSDGKVIKSQHYYTFHVFLDIKSS